MRKAAETRPIRLSLPATSANLGPGFDALGLALSMHLTVDAHPAPTWQIHATGRDPELVQSLDNNLIVDTFQSVLAAHHLEAPPLRLQIHNEIPLGGGCGSSAAALCAGIALADHFGSLHLTDAQIVHEASIREGHPDNVAACWLGGFTVSTTAGDTTQTATFPGDPTWQLLLAMQKTSLATKKARALLPETYSKADTVANIGAVSLLVAAFAQNRLDLLQTATADRIHQPFRQDACPLLKSLLPLAQEPGFASVTLSGAGPSVLLILHPELTVLEAEARVAELTPEAELVPVTIAGGATRTILSS